MCVCVFLGLHNLKILNFLDAEAKFSYVSSVLFVFSLPFLNSHEAFNGIFTVPLQHVQQNPLSL